MTITIIIKRPQTKPLTLQWDVDDLKMSDMRKLWELEQALNSLPSCPFRFHINIEEMR